jgi:hypothetical protein
MYVNNMWASEMKKRRTHTYTHTRERERGFWFLRSSFVLSLLVKVENI